MGRVLSDQANSDDPIITQAAKAVRVGGHGFRACSYALKGISERTAKWVHALETATIRCDLRFLTLLPFQNVLPGHLFRNRRAWCALCFEDWRANGQIVYEPLLWGLKVSTHCLVHARALDYTCPRCGRTLNPLGVFSRPGHCGRCGDWLAGRRLPIGIRCVLTDRAQKKKRGLVRRPEISSRNFRRFIRRLPGTRFAEVLLCTLQSSRMATSSHWQSTFGARVASYRLGSTVLQFQDSRLFCEPAVS